MTEITRKRIEDLISERANQRFEDGSLVPAGSLGIGTYMNLLVDILIEQVNEAIKDIARPDD